MIGPNVFGHVGFRGSSATFADPDCKMPFGYLVNRLGGEYLINERGQSLIDSSYDCLMSTNHPPSHIKRNLDFIPYSYNMRLRIIVSSISYLKCVVEII